MCILISLGWIFALALAACGGVDDASSDDLALDESEATAKTNVNVAEAAALARVPGLNATLGEAIVRERATRPYFELNDLSRVPGLTAAVLKRARTRLTVGDTCGGSARRACPAAQQCRKKTTASNSLGVCLPLPPVTPVTLVPESTWSIYAHDPSQKFAARVIYGYTDRTASDFARAADKASLPWYRDLARREPGHLEKPVEYMTPAPAGYYTQVNRAVTVAPQGTGILYRVVFRCRGAGGEHDCEETPVAYASATKHWELGWAGQWGLRPYYGEGRGTALADDVVVSASGHYPSSLTLELWAPGVTDNAPSEVGLKVELETDLLIDGAPVGHPPAGGALRRYPMRIEGRTGNNWRATFVMPATYQRTEWNQRYRFRARFSTDGGRSWQSAGRGEGLGESFRTLFVRSPCADGGTGC